MSQSEKNAVELGNEELLLQISKHREAMEKLKAQLQPTPPRVEISLLECNAAAKVQRLEKFNEAEKIKKAVTMALTRTTEKKISKPTPKPS